MKGDLPSELGSCTQIEHLDFSKYNNVFTLIQLYNMSRNLSL